MLPARGSLLRFHLKAAGAGGKAVSLKLEAPLGAIDTGERVTLQPTSAEVTVP